ncbi:intracellular short-chain-length polyhydroxyalkanoate depolymerase [Halomarina litorea]|uniref:intracellular short-chain-length polyhydroxyalkanoate depolymerase n=1 Tax=Halomarina litorea TaxID=2961595 RepID=UPI0020C2C26F|nr:alpha/beta hydrolase [Halomarina sp. BCD28]
MDAEAQFVDVPTGETIAYRVREGDDGDATPIVLLHGNMTSSVHWDLVFEEMDPRYTLYAVDMRGFGESTYETPVDSLDDFADDVAGVVDALGLDRFHLMGWSTGGGVAMAYTAEHTDRVERLVLVAPVSTRGYPIYRKDEEGQPTDEVLTTKEDIAADPVQVAPILAAYENEDREMLRTVWDGLIYTDTQPDEERYEKYLDDMLTQRNLVDVDYALAYFNVSDEENAYGSGDGRANDVTVPTLVLRGERDLVIGAGMTEEVMADLPNAEFVELTDAGHSPFVDDLDAVLAEVEGFLAGEE